jgi:hypothetical protein
VPHVVQVDLWQTGRLGDLLEAPGDGVRVGRLAVFPAEQPAAILVVRAEVGALGIKAAPKAPLARTALGSALPRPPSPGAPGRDGPISSTLRAGWLAVLLSRLPRLFIVQLAGTTSRPPFGRRFAMASPA